MLKFDRCDRKTDFFVYDTIPNQSFLYKGYISIDFPSPSSTPIQFSCSLCPKKFETGWKKLINKFPACKQYLTKVLYPCKNSWASFAINRNFTAGIQSTQRVEVTNRIVKEKLNRSSCLTDVVGEIQRIFD